MKKIITIKNKRNKIIIKNKMIKKNKMTVYNKMNKMITKKQMNKIPIKI